MMVCVGQRGVDEWGYLRCMKRCVGAHVFEFDCGSLLSLFKNADPRWRRHPTRPPKRRNGNEEQVGGKV